MTFASGHELYSSGIAHRIGLRERLGVLVRRAAQLLHDDAPRRQLRPLRGIEQATL